MNVKIIVHVKKIVVGILAHVFVRTISYLKTITDTSVMACDEIISITDILSTKMTINIATNVSINSDSKKIRYIKLITTFCIQFY